MSAILIILFVIPTNMQDSRPDDAKVDNCAVNVAFSAFLYFGLDVKYESVAELFLIPFRRDGVQVPMSVVQDVLTTNTSRSMRRKNHWNSRSHHLYDP